MSEVETYKVELRIGHAGMKEVLVQAKNGRQAMEIAEEEHKSTSDKVSAITVRKNKHLN